MANLTVKTGKGFSKADALVNAGIDTKVSYDSTLAYKKAKAELGVNFDINEFAQSQIATRAKGLVGALFSVTIEAGKEDSRERPYTEKVVITTKARKYTGTYAVVTGSKELIGATIVDLADDKSEGRKKAKDYTTEHKVDTTVLPLKHVTDGEDVAAYITYTPSLGAKQGEYLFFALEG